MIECRGNELAVKLPNITEVVKFGYSEKATKFEKIFHILYVHRVPEQNVFFFNLMDRKKLQVKFYLKVSVYLLGLDI